MSIDLYGRDAVLTPIRQILDSLQRERTAMTVSVRRFPSGRTTSYEPSSRVSPSPVGKCCAPRRYSAPVLHRKVLAQMLGQTTVSLLPVWEEALSSELLVPDGDELAFAHEVLRRAVAESLPPAIGGDAVKREHGRLPPWQQDTADVLDIDQSAPQAIAEPGRIPSPSNARPAR